MCGRSETAYQYVRVWVPEAWYRTSFMRFDCGSVDHFAPPDDRRLSDLDATTLVRFRVKKTIPFDIDAAALSYYVQPHSGKGKIEVVAVTVGLEIVSRYEALFRNATEIEQRFLLTDTQTLQPWGNARGPLAIGHPTPGCDPHTVSG